jgi:hypothetical protein
MVMSKAVKTKNALDTFAPSHKKNLDNLKLLFSCSEIKEVIATAREYLAIPPNGFSGPNQEKEMERWWGEMYRRSNELRESERLHNQVKKIKKEVQEKLTPESMAKKQTTLLYQKLPENYLTKTVADIIRYYDLPNNYEDSIRTYIISGIITAPPFPFSIVSHSVEDEPLLNPAKSVSLDIYAELTEDDRKSLNRIIKIFREQLPQSPESITNLDQKLQIEKELASKETIDPVEYIKHKRTAKDIAEAVDAALEQDTHTTVSQVNEAPRELRRLRKRFTKKLGK